MYNALFPLKVKTVRRETAECVSVSLAVPETQKDQFSFEAGQYLGLEAKIDGEVVRRSYSICSSPQSGELTVAIKKVTDGKFSSFANEQLAEGDVLQVMPPRGGFIIKKELKEKEAAQFVFFASGSGITPVLSMIHDVLDTNPTANLIVFYGNRNTDQIIFREEIENLKNIHLNRLSVHYILSKEHPGSEAFFGRINADKCKLYAKYFFDPKSVEGFYLCGPGEMIFEIKDTLAELGVPAEKVHFELFTTAGMPKPKAKIIEVPKDACSVKIKLNDVLLDFSLEDRGKNLLDAALEQGADLPYACKGGVCSTCKAKVLDGKVEMQINYALEPDELAAGYVLSCQAIATSDRVFLDFDV